MKKKSIQNMILRSKILDTKHVTIEVSNRDTQTSYFLMIDLDKIDVLSNDPCIVESHVSMFPIPADPSKNDTITLEEEDE